MATNRNNLRSQQLNPCDHLFWKSRGYPERPQNWQEILEEMGYYDNTSDEDDETESEEEYYSSEEEYYSSENESEDYEDHRVRSNANNPNNDEYWRLRGWSGRPDDWRDRIYGK